MYGPIVTGCRGSSAVTVSGTGPSQSCTVASSSKLETRRFWWLVKKPSKATIAGSRTSARSATRSAIRFRS